MARLTTLFSSNRMLREYVETLYLPATRNYRRRNAEGGNLVKQLLAWQASLEQHWSKIRFGEVQTTREGGSWHFMVPVHLGGLDPLDIRVELYADPQEGGAASLCRPLTREETTSSAPGWHLYRGSVQSERPADHFTPRIVPVQPQAAIPLEEHHILWAR